MFTIQNKLIADIKDYASHKREMQYAGERINKEARKLLVELQKVNGWECMIKACADHYAQCPKDFFEWCSVTHTDDAVQFIKGYSDGEEYEVLEISLRKSLKDQVHDRMQYLEERRHKNETKQREIDLAVLEHLRKKYGL